MIYGKEYSTILIFRVLPNLLGRVIQSNTVPELSRTITLIKSVLSYIKTVILSDGYKILISNGNY